MASQHSNKFIDLTGSTFGRLTVVERSSNTKDGKARWLCQCSCGTQTIVTGRDIRSGHSQSCGCLKRIESPALVPLDGRKFGRWTVLSRGSDSRNGRVRWLCKCECGKTALIMGYSLRGGTSESCGCLKQELTKQRLTTHGSTNTPEFKIWQGMLKRCGNPNSAAFPRYGGRGITVCDRWKDSFENFLADMGPRPSPKHSIDRKKNDEGYKPGNCRWATMAQQANNRESTVILTFNGKSLTICEWAREIGVKHQTIYCRYWNGLPIESVLRPSLLSRKKTG